MGIALTVLVLKRTEIFFDGCDYYSSQLQQRLPFTVLKLATVANVFFMISSLQ